MSNLGRMLSASEMKGMIDTKSLKLVMILHPSLVEAVWLRERELIRPNLSLEFQPLDHDAKLV
jgi:hypothetical protein